jgi:hypothetical protein
LRPCGRGSPVIEGAQQYAATSLFRAPLIETLLQTNELVTVAAELATAFALVQRSDEMSFTGGGELPDLQHARAMLAAL